MFLQVNSVSIKFCDEKINMSLIDEKNDGIVVFLGEKKTKSQYIRLISCLLCFGLLIVLGGLFILNRKGLIDPEGLIIFGPKSEKRTSYRVATLEYWVTEPKSCSKVD